MSNDLQLTTSIDKLIDVINNTNDEEELNSALKALYVYSRKRDIVRSVEYGDIKDKILKEISQRLETRSGNFSNEDLVKWLTAVSNLTDKLNEAEKAPMPTIAIQNNINISSDEDKLSRESKEKIKSVISAFLSQNSSYSTTEEPINIDIDEVI